MRAFAIASTVAAASAACAPEQIFINYADAPTQMRISWATSCAATAFVAYGTTPSVPLSTTGPAPTQYKSPGYTSPYLYHTTLTGLTPNTMYYVRLFLCHCALPSILPLTPIPPPPPRSSRWATPPVA